jgi:hypothetical protein
MPSPLGQKRTDDGKDITYEGVELREVLSRAGVSSVKKCAKRSQTMS